MDDAIVFGDAVCEFGKTQQMHVSAVDGDMISCSWFEGGTVHTGTFHRSSLYKVPADHAKRIPSGDSSLTEDLGPSWPR